jgi:hypothetical protein
MALPPASVEAVPATAQVTVVALESALPMVPLPFATEQLCQGGGVVTDTLNAVPDGSALGNDQVVELAFKVRD